MITSDIERLSWIRHSLEVTTPEGIMANPGEPRGEDNSRVSPEAQRLYAERAADPVERIRSRIRSGFYARPEILKSIVESLTPDTLRITPSV